MNIIDDSMAWTLGTPLFETLMVRQSQRPIEACGHNGSTISGVRGLALVFTPQFLACSNMHAPL